MVLQDLSSDADVVFVGPNWRHITAGEFLLSFKLESLTFQEWILTA